MDTSIEATAESAEDLIRYREGVETLLALRSETPISNAFPAHAAILFDVFFKNAVERVRIFCYRLDRTVFDEPALVESARWALARGVKVDIVVQEEPHETRFLAMLKKAGTPVYCADEPLDQAPFNFAVMDDRALRVEPQRDQCKATAVMHSPEKARAWGHYFDVLLLQLQLRMRSEVAAGA